MDNSGVSFLDNLDVVFRDLQYLVDHIRKQPEVAVRRWSDIPCDNSEIALIRFNSFMSAPDQTRTLAVTDRPEHKVIVDIITRSALHSLLEYNQMEKVIKYRDSVPLAVRNAVSHFLAKCAGGGIGTIPFVFPSERT